MGRPRNPDSPWKVRVDELDEPDELITLAEAQAKYGLNKFHVYAAAKRGEVVRVRRRGSQPYYLDTQLRELAKAIGLYSECSAA